MKQPRADIEMRDLMVLCFRAGVFTQFVSAFRYAYPTPQHAAAALPWEQMRALTALIPNDGIVPESGLLFKGEDLPTGDFWIAVLEFAYTLLPLRDYAARPKWQQYTQKILADWTAEQMSNHPMRRVLNSHRQNSKATSHEA